MRQHSLNCYHKKRPDVHLLVVSVRVSSLQSWRVEKHAERSQLQEDCCVMSVQRSMRSSLLDVLG